MWFWSLRGRENQSLGYEEVRKLQLALVDLRAQDLIPDTLLFLEHQPTVTRGRGLQWTGVPRERHMPIFPHLLKDISFAESERGGDLTYHGPGQLVIYPIFKLDGKGFGPHHDVTGFLRKFEQIFIRYLTQLGLTGKAKENATGIWIENQKVASIGIAVRKWVTYHGIAINCINDLKPFFLISPCGFNPEVMTRLADWLPLQENSWRADLERSLASQVAIEASHSNPVQIETILLESVPDRLKDAGVPSELLHHFEMLPASSL
jgi:lipoate-protein ligase B